MGAPASTKTTQTSETPPPIGRRTYALSPENTIETGCRLVHRGGGRDVLMLTSPRNVLQELWDGS